MFIIATEACILYVSLILNLIIHTIESEAYSEPIDQRVVTTELNEYAVIGPNASKVATIAKQHCVLITLPMQQIFIR